MKKLLGILNRLSYSKHFLRYIINMARDMQADLQILLVLHSEQYPQGTPGMTSDATLQDLANLENLAEKAKHALQKDVEGLNDEIQGELSVEVSVEIGMITPGMDKFLADSGTNMIVLNGEENVSIWSPGSFNMDIINNADYPVWVIPHKSVYQGFNEIIYATDYNKEDMDTIRRLVELTRPFSPGITALHITDNLDFDERIKKESFQELVKGKTGYDKVKVKAIVHENDEDIGQLVCDLASLFNANLIVVLKENKHFLDRIFKTSSTKKIIQQANIPVLVFHENK
jgi:nucleotide-binding universal stress UspA family protein